MPNKVIAENLILVSLFEVLIVVVVVVVVVVVALVIFVDHRPSRCVPSSSSV